MQGARGFQGEYGVLGVQGVQGVQGALGMQGSAVTSWAPIQQLMMNPQGGEQAEGVAAQHAPAAREEAAKKLIANHVAVLRDVTNDSPLTQKELRRVPQQHAAHVEECLHEVCRRLLGRRPGSEQIAIRADQPSRAAAWAMTAQYLVGRIQGTTSSTGLLLRMAS